METMYGKWEGVPSLTENFEAFCEKAGIADDKKEAYRNMVTIVQIEKSGQGVRVVFEVKGTPIKQDLTFEEGVPKTYKGMDGEDITSSYMVKGNRMYDHFKSVKDGKTMTWEVERYVDGDMLVTIQTKEGVSMINKMKRI